MNRDELVRFLAKTLVDTAEATQILGCSRQNIDDLMKRGKLQPVYTAKRVRLFLREDILARRQ